MKKDIRDNANCELACIVSNDEKLYNLKNNYNALLIAINKIYIYSNVQLLLLVEWVAEYQKEANK
jgi:hypothetical protein